MLNTSHGKFSEKVKELLYGVIIRSKGIKLRDIPDGMSNQEYYSIYVIESDKFCRQLEENLDKIRMYNAVIFGTSFPADLGTTKTVCIYSVFADETSGTIQGKDYTFTSHYGGKPSTNGVQILTASFKMKGQERYRVFINYYSISCSSALLFSHSGVWTNNENLSVAAGGGYVGVTAKLCYEYEI